jgi:uracil-DNA glycosylase
MTMTIQTWDDLNYWSTGEWQVIQERLDDYDKSGVRYNPKRELLFAALDACPYSSVRVCILGQDPYPVHSMATGLAFSVPPGEKDFPPTLQNILKELKDDLGLDTGTPDTGDLTPWAEQGVLLWNAFPSCEAGKPGSHHWDEWKLLTEEIIKACSDKGIVFGFLGRKAYDFKKFIDEDANSIVFANHPSPLAVNRTTPHPFLGSRFFTTINSKLVEMKLEPIDWRV